jgi:FAD-dependent oxidoreductase domain-containing protein 1
MNLLTRSKFGMGIIGGGILGSSTAYFLLKQSPTTSVCVIELDPTYEFASTLRAS